MNLIVLDGENIYIYTKEFINQYTVNLPTEDLLKELGFNSKDVIFAFSDDPKLYINSDYTADINDLK